MSQQKLVPVHEYNDAGQNEIIGHVPSCGSSNPVIGVVRCGDCGEAATVHNPKGKRKGYYYTNCVNCGIDQRSGKNRQDSIRQYMARTVEALPPKITSFEPQRSAGNVLEQAEKDALNDASETPQANEPQANKPEQTEPEQSESGMDANAQAEPESTPEPEPEPKQAERPKALIVIIGAALGGIVGALL